MVKDPCPTCLEKGVKYPQGARSAPDPDGVRRCRRHSTDPDIAAGRRAQGRTGGRPRKTPEVRAVEQARKVDHDPATAEGRAALRREMIPYLLSALAQGEYRAATALNSVLESAAKEDTAGGAGELVIVEESEITTERAEAIRAEMREREAGE